MSGSHLPESPRAARIGELLRGLWGQPRGFGDDPFTALTVLIVDAALQSDAVALRVGQHGLQRVHARLLSATEPSAAEVEGRGRIRALLEVATWALRRLSAGPSAALTDLDKLLLHAIAERPGATAEELAEVLNRKPQDVAAAATSLSKAGFAVSRGRELTAAWEPSPRGWTYLRAA